MLGSILSLGGTEVGNYVVGIALILLGGFAKWIYDKFLKEKKAHSVSRESRIHTELRRLETDIKQRGVQIQDVDHRLRKVEINMVRDLSAIQVELGNIKSMSTRSVEQSDRIEKQLNQISERTAGMEVALASTRLK